MGVDILLDIQHFGNADLVRESIRKISDRTRIPINIEICNGYQLLDKLQTNPNYDFVILHVGQEDAGAYRQADRCRRLSNAIMVAESSLFPCGREEVLRHFDEYIGSLTITEPFEAMLKKYGYIS